MHYNQKLIARWKLGFFIAVGLDSDPLKTPAHLIKKHGEDKLAATLEFNKSIVDKTKDIVLAYKINIAFYEKYGPAGLAVFYQTIDYIKEVAPEVFLILDVKRGDIGNTNDGYTIYLEMADAMTINGYFGEIANEPFLVEKFKDKLIIVLGQTSNKGTKLQNMIAEGYPVYLQMTKDVMKWGDYKNCGIVIGATYPLQLLQARSEIGPDRIILVPGVGAQNGDLEKTITYGTNEDNEGIIINLSRSVIYASKAEDFAEKAREEVLRVNAEIAEYLKLPKVHWEDIRASFYEEETFKILAQESAILKDDHFVYQAGQHGPAYVAKDKVNPGPLAIDEIGRMLADLMKDNEIDTVVVPAAGAIVLGHCVAKYLNYFKEKPVKSIFLEKTGEKNEKGLDTFEYTRGYKEYVIGKNVAILEDIINSGHSVKSIFECVEEAGGKVTTVGVICNRGGIKAEDIGENIVLVNLSILNLDKYDVDKCPLCANGIPINTEFGHGKEFLEKQKK